MIKRFSVVLGIVVVLAASYAIAQANIRRIIEGRGPRLLKPHMDVDVPTSSSTKRDITAVRVRAEMKKNADCSGPTVSDLDQPEHSTRAGAEYSEAVLLGTKGGYRIKY